MFYGKAILNENYSLIFNECIFLQTSYVFGNFEFIQIYFLIYEELLERTCKTFYPTKVFDKFNLFFPSQAP